jgi:hypothetical protein
MTAIYEFKTYLRVPADSEREAREIAEDVADTVSHGDTTLALDKSEPPEVSETDEE